MATDGVVQALPGFAEWADTTRKDRAGGADLSDCKRWTAERLRLCHPGVYEAIGRGLFYWQMPISALADICRVSRKTVAAIRDRAISEAHRNGADPAALFCVKLRERGQRDIIKARIVEEILDRLSDPAKVEKMETVELVTVLGKLEDRRVETVQPPTPSHFPERQVDAEITMYEDTINGLYRAKKSAATDFGEKDGCSGKDENEDSGRAGKEAEMGENRSTNNVKHIKTSLLQSIFITYLTTASIISHLIY